ncbi:MAG TPA: glycosyltransferase, partial [Longimicrobiales bacterium]|nr:glycosyltransferase [Longimicrobiales bacterium]
MIDTLALWTVAASAAALVYTYVGYPATLWILARLWPSSPLPLGDPDPWPTVSICVPAFNEEGQIRELIRSLLALDYPRDRLQILIVSDASDDATDDIVREYAGDGVELLRMKERGGKNRAENAAAEHLRHEIIVNTDASIRIRPDALKPLVAVFRDPRIGCASGHDLSVDPGQEAANVGESGYVGYEMWIRDLETRVAGIIGASGCFYAIRPDLHRLPLPEALSRDFSAALHAQENGFRAVSVPRAVCLVPRGTSLRREYRRKVRTITRGMQTLWYKRHLLNPARDGLFAWMLFSHKVLRWLLPWAALAAFVALAILSAELPSARVLFGGGTLLLALAAAGWVFSEEEWVPRIFTVPAFLVAGNVAAAHALIRAVT